MPLDWRVISVSQRCGQRIRDEATRLSVPQYRIIEMACAEILKMEPVPEPSIGDTAREMFRLARPEIK